MIKSVTKVKNTAHVLLVITVLIRLQSSPVGTTIIKDIRAHDIDSGVNSLIEYFVMQGSEGEKDQETFTINYPHQGIVILNRTLDFEEQEVHFVTIMAKVCSF